MLLLAIYAIIVLIDLVSIPFLWRNNRARALMPFGTALLFIALLIPSNLLGMQARMLKFRMQKPKYEKVIELMELGEIPVSNGIGRVDIPPEYSHPAYAIIADRDTNGVLSVEFLIGGGFPVKHTGFLYRSDDNPKKWKHITRWPRVIKTERCWYRISD